MLSPIPYPRLSKALRTVRVVDAAAEPVSLADYQLYLRQAKLAIAQAAFDIKARAARRLVEDYLGRALVSATYTGTMDLPPGVEYNGGGSIGSVLARFAGYNPVVLELPCAPLRQVSGIFITDDTGAITTCDPATYWVSKPTNEPGRIALRQTAVWPDTLGRSFETFSVQYTVGYSIPFTAAAAVLTTLQPHGLVNGTVQRVWTTSDGTLPTGLAAGTDYYVVGATALTFGLAATPAGGAIATSGTVVGPTFSGAMQENFLRAILATAAADMYSEKKKSSKYDVSESGALPDLAKEMLGMKRIMNL
jgi:hypothetical protein